MNYKKTKDYMGGDSIKRIDVLAQLGEMYSQLEKKNDISYSCVKT